MSAVRFGLACFIAIFPIVNPVSSAISKVMGLITLSVGIQFVINGLSAVVRQWET